MKNDKEGIKKILCEFIDSLDEIDIVKIECEVIENLKSNLFIAFKTYEPSPVRKFYLAGRKYNNSKIGT